MNHCNRIMSNKYRCDMMWNRTERKLDLGSPQAMMKDLHFALHLYMKILDLGGGYGALCPKVKLNFSSYKEIC